MRFKIYLAIFVSLTIFASIIGCDDVEEAHERRLDDANFVVSHLFYIKDDKTGICFAVWKEFDNQAAITVVPCEKVK
jgi:hypothetical protein